jgi:hypothetical protein
VQPRAGLYDLENGKFLTLPGLELRPLGRPARSQSLYRLRYPASIVVLIFDTDFYELNYYHTIIDYWIF